MTGQIFPLVSVEREALAEFQVCTVKTKEIVLRREVAVFAEITPILQVNIQKSPFLLRLSTNHLMPPGSSQEICWSTVPIFPSSWEKADPGQLEVGQAGLCPAKAPGRVGAWTPGLFFPLTDTVPCPGRSSDFVTLYLQELMV